VWDAFAAIQFRKPCFDLGDDYQAFDGIIDSRIRGGVPAALR